MDSFTRPKRRLVAEINVVPYIDVMLVLLVIFMITAPLMMQGVDVELPQAPSELMPENDDEPLVVSIKADGTFYIDLAGDAEAPRPLAEIVDIVGKVLDEKPATPILVWGDRNVPYGEVVSLMSQLQGVGATGIGLVTEPPRPE